MDASGSRIGSIFAVDSKTTSSFRAVGIPAFDRQLTLAEAMFGGEQLETSNFFEALGQANVHMDASGQTCANYSRAGQPESGTYQ